jgi:dienelactone hydrolase
LIAAALAGAAPLAAQTGPGTPAAPAALPPPIPAEALGALPFIRDPVLSPDGLHLAARMTAQNRNWIAVYDLRLPLTEQRPLQIEEGDYDLLWLRWAGNGRLLFGIRVVLRPDGQEIPVTRAGSIDLRTGQTMPLIGGAGILGDDVIYVDPAGTYILLSAQDSLVDFPSVDRIDLATGRRSLVQSSRPGVWNWYADSQGVVRVGVDYGERRARLYYRSGAGEDLRRIDARPAARDGSIIDAIHFTAEADRGIIVTNEVTGRFGAYAFDFAANARGAAIFEHPEVDVTAVVLGRTGQALGVTYEDDRPRVHWVDPEMQRIQRAIDRAVPGKVNHIIDRSDDGNKVLVWSTAADDPGTYYLYDRTTHQMHGFADPYGRLADYRFAPVQPVSYRNRDGLAIPAYLTLPPGRAERGLPLIVLPHGGPFARDSWAFDAEVQFLASRGYAVLQPQFRGSTGYGREHVERGTGQFGSGMIDDMEDGIDWLAGRGIVDPARVCIMGSSYGGYAAMWAPIHSPQRYRCAISFAGVSDLGAQLRYDFRIATATRYFRDWQRQVRGEQRVDPTLISPLQQVARLRVPVLIAHGDKDRRVRVSQSRNMVRALTRAGASVDSVFYPEAGHGFSRPEDSIDFLRRVEAFLARHNPADAPAPAAASR